MPPRAYEIKTTIQQESWIRSLRLGGARKNVPIVFTIDGSVDPILLAHAVDQLVARHAVLRLSFDAEQPDRALVHPPTPAEVEVHDVDDDWINLGIAFATKPFEFEDTRRVRCSARRLTDGTTLVSLVADRLSCDGLSGSILASELIGRLADLSEASAAPKPDISYARFAREQRAWLDSDAAAASRKFWTAEFEHWGAERPHCVLGKNPSNPPGKTMRSTYPLPGPAVNGLDSLVSRHHTTRFVVLAATLLVDFIEEFEEPSAGLTTDFHGRTQSWVQNTVGMFTHSLDVHLERGEAADLDHAVTAVRDRMTRRVNHALPRAVIARDHPVAQVTGPPQPTLYLAISPFDLRISDADSAVIKTPFDPRAFIDGASHRLDIEIGTAGRDVALTTSMRANHFDAGEVAGLLERTAERLARAGGSPTSPNFKPF